MPITRSGMCWDSHGAPDAPVVLLLEGFTGQLIGWRQEFCDLLVAAGMRVLRMDNRDIGRSRHEPVPSAYTIADMAGDVIDVLDDAGIDTVTVVGQSMGGMIAQHVALDYSERVDALVLFYTTPTLADVASDLLVGDIPLPGTRAEAIEIFVEASARTASLAASSDDATWKRELAGCMYDRDPSHAGLRNQRDAIARFDDLQHNLHELSMPIALIHGRADTLISPRGSLRIAEHAPHAELHLYPELGHEIASALWPDFVTIIVRTVRRVATSRRRDPVLRPAPPRPVGSAPTTTRPSQRP